MLRGQSLSEVAFQVVSISRKRNVWIQTGHQKVFESESKEKIKLELNFQKQKPQAVLL